MSAALSSSSSAVAKQPGSLSRYVRPLRIFAGIVLFLAAWQLLYLYVAQPLLMPSPMKVVDTLGKLIASGELYTHIVASMRRILVGYVLGCLIGIVLGLVIGRWATVHDLATPFLEFIRPLSPVALLPLVLIWFGIDETAKYFLVGYTAVIIVLINTSFGVTSMPIIRERAARCLGATEMQVFWHVLLPSTIPYIVTGMRTALGFSFMAIVAGELIAAETGIGFLIMQSRILIQVDQTFAGLITLSVLGALSDLVFRLTLTRLATRYQQDIYNV